MQLQELTNENEKLKQMNGAIVSNLQENREDKNNALILNYKTEMADLHAQINDLKEKNGAHEINVEKMVNKI